MQIERKKDAALPGGRVWALKAQKVLSRTLCKAEEWHLFPMLSGISFQFLTPEK